MPIRAMRLLSVASVLLYLDKCRNTNGGYAGTDLEGNQHLNIPGMQSGVCVGYITKPAGTGNMACFKFLIKPIVINK